MGLLAANIMLGIPPGSAPVWNQIPVVVIADEAVSQVVDIEPFVSGAVSLAVNVGSTALPTGMTIVNLTLSYDGLGADGTTVDVILDAINPDGTTASSAFSIIINATPAFTTFPVFDFYKAVVEMRGGVVVPASNTRFWDKFVYPTVFTSLETTLAAAETALNAAAPGDIIALTDGVHAKNDIVVTADGTFDLPIIFVSQTLGNCLVSNSEFQWDGNFLYALGFVDARYDQNGTDLLVAFAQRYWPDGFDWISDGARNRLCFSTFAGKQADDQIWNIDGAGAKIDNHVDHCHFGIHQGSDVPGGASEYGQVGQNQIDINYYSYNDSNFGEMHLNSGGTVKSVGNESERNSLKSSRDMIVNNVSWNCNSHDSVRAGREATLWANWVFGPGAARAGGFSIGGKDNLSGCNYVEDNNLADVSGEGMFDLKDGDPGDVSREEASNNEVVFNTGVRVRRGIIVGRVNRPTEPTTIHYDANAILEATSRNVLWGGDGTNPQYTANVWGPNKGGAPAAVVEAIPEWTVDNGVSIPTVAGNLDGTASDISTMGPLVIALQAAGALYDIVGQLKPATGADQGAIEIGADVSTNPWQHIIDNAGHEAGNSPRQGIIHFLDLRYPNAGPIYAFRDGVWVQTFNAALNTVDTGQIGFDWGSDWDTQKVDIFAEEGITGPEGNEAIRMRIGYDRDYTTRFGIGQIRDKLFWPRSGDVPFRFEYDVDYWLCIPLVIPSGYESDSIFAREIYWQLHTDSSAPGVLTLVIDQGSLKILSRVTDTATSGGTEVVEFQQAVTTDKGEITYITINWRMNPFDVETEITAGMGAKAQVGVTYPANTGRLRIWKSLDPGATCVSADKGNVTNGGGSRADFLITDKNNVPMGRVPDWKGGVTDADSMSSEFGVYKPNWFNGELFANRPAIPHAGSTKAGPIEVYILRGARWGASNSNFKSVHPLKTAEPT